jgi:beta-lactamase superfamily II metal-dependent hydrolase
MNRFFARLFSAVAMICYLLLLPVAYGAKTDPLQIYFVDVEGGQATLFITPEHKSLLIDTGWPADASGSSKSAERIAAVAHQAGLHKIDFVLITHYHTDHVGGVPALVAQIPVGTFIDHGPNRETEGITEQGFEAYRKVLASGPHDHVVAAPGDNLYISGIDSTVISGDGKLIEKPLPGAGDQNAACANAPKFSADQTENARSLGVLFTFGKLRILDLGDLTSDKEVQLVCPVNKLGKIDIYIVSHHGWSQSNSAPFVQAIAPRVAIMDNGAKKGGTPSAWDTIRQASSLEDLWQLHYSDEGGSQHNAADSFIANLPGPDAGNWIRLTAFPDGNFDVFNSRTQKAKRYPASAR